MKLANGTIYLTKEPLNNLIAQRDIPLKYSIEIVRLARKLHEEIAVLDQARNGLILKHGETRDNGQVGLTPDSPNWSAFAAEINELMALETELNVTRVQIPDTVVIPLIDLMALEPFIEVVQAC